MHVMTVARATPPEARAQPASAIPRVVSSVPPAVGGGRAWPYRRTLMIGMSDDEVLNLPGWGVPKNISREKKPREWREDWSYGSALAGERRLRFVNSKLVDVVDVPAATQVASLTIQ